MPALPAVNAPALIRDRNPVLLGVVHLPALPGSPRYAGGGVGAVVEHALRDAEALLEAGFDGYVVENFGDAPFFAGSVPPHTLTMMTRVLGALPRGNALVGVNVLRNDAMGALAIAAAMELDFIRVNVLVGAAVTDQGVIEGQAATVMRQRQRLAPNVAVLADVDVKHASPLGRDYDLTEAAEETAYRGLADGLIVTGKATGKAASLGDLEAVRRVVPDRPLLVGSGATADTLPSLLRLATGAIVGTATKRDGRVSEPVDPARARAIVEAVRGA